MPDIAHILIDADLCSAKEMVNDAAVLGSFSPIDLLIRFPVNDLPLEPSPLELKTFAETRVREILPHEYYHYLQLLGTVAGLRRFLFRFDILQNRLNIMRHLFRMGDGFLPFPLDNKILENRKIKNLMEKNGFISSKLIYYEGGREAPFDTVAQLRSETNNAKSFVKTFTHTKIGSYHISAPLPYIVGVMNGRDCAFALGLRDIIEGSAYCLSLVWKERKDGQDAVRQEIQKGQKSSDMAVYHTMLRTLPFFFQDNDFVKSDLNSFEVMIILGELSLMLDFYMLNISPELILALSKGDKKHTSFMEKTDCNPACYFLILLNSFQQQWRQLDPPITPDKVVVFCDRILAAIETKLPGLSFQRLIDKADDARKIIFENIYKEFCLLPEIQHVISARVAKIFELRKALKYPIMGLNLLDNEQLATCYETNPVPYLIGCNMNDLNHCNSEYFSDGHLLGALSELHKMTMAYLSGSSWACDFLKNSSGCPLQRTSFCDGKNIQESFSNPPNIECTRTLAFHFLIRIFR